MLEGLNLLISSISRRNAIRGGLGAIVLISMLLADVLSDSNAARFVEQARTWPMQQAVITSASAKKGCNKGLGYSPVVGYSYAAGDIANQQGLIQFGTYDCRGNEVEIQAILDRYKVGSPLMVHVNPQAPSETIFEDESLGSAVGKDGGMTRELALLILFTFGALLSLSERQADIRNRLEASRPIAGRWHEPANDR